MNVQELIDSVWEIGGELDLRGERIHFRLPHTTHASRLVEEMRARREEVVAALKERDKVERDRVSCGSPDCAGCYEVGEGRKIHPPKPTQEWLKWHQKWEAAGRIQ